MNQLKSWLRLPAALGAALIALVLLVPMAQADEPKPGYTQFAGCPSPTENPNVLQCTRTVIDGGHFQMGTKDVPIKNPITLSGGIQFDGTVVATAKGGLAPVPQQVPGGIIGLTGLDWLVDFLNIEQLKLYATTELAGSPTIKAGILSMPIRVHLTNPALGSNCYVGTFASPINLKLTVGTTSPPAPNKPITGFAGVPKFDPATGILKQENGKYVDNSFAAPGASGCVLTIGFIPISINGLVNSQSGLPSPAGTNETIQEFDQESTSPHLVY
jgi:hypothetical protein